MAHDDAATIDIKLDMIIVDKISNMEWHTKSNLKDKKESIKGIYQLFDDVSRNKIAQVHINEFATSMRIFT